MTNVVYSLFSGYDSWGNETWYAGTTYPAVIEQANHKIINAQGVEVACRTRLTILRALDVSVKDRFTLPDGTSPKIQFVQAMLDSNGNPYYAEVSFQ